MKKTTTRLATIAAVVVMSAFAIVLAQHDARKRDRQQEPLAITSNPSEPAEPLRSDLVWPGRNPIVRANNGQVANNASAHEAYSIGQSEATSNHTSPPTNSLRSDDLAESSLAESSVAESSLGENSLGENSLPAAYPEIQVGSSAFHGAQQGMPPQQAPPALESNSMDSSHLSLSDSLESNSLKADLPDATEVVGASGEQPAVPAWLPEGDSPPSLPANSLPAASSLADPNTLTMPGSLPMPAGPVATLSSPQPLGSSTSQSQTASQAFGGVPSVDSIQVPSPTQPSASPGMASLQGRSGANQPGAFGIATEAGPRAALVSNQPGSRFLDGSQNPVLQIHKRAPEEIQVGKKATFVITVRNAGNATAHDVSVVDRVPQGARFAEASPPAMPTADGVLSWVLGEMSAGDERTISLQIIPEVEGEVGSVASVHFAAQASVRTVATLPQLVLQVESIGPVIIGQAQQVVVTIQNTGSGVAKGVRLEADIPVQFRHESGETQLEAYVGDLRPSESRRLTLGVSAVEPGQSQCVLRAVNDDGVQAERALEVDVRAPQLTAAISGPSLRYLERQASYQVVVSNSGTAMARNLDFMVHLPVGLKFISTDVPQANYNPQTHSVSLGLAELDSGQTAPFTITVLPVQLGTQVVRFNGTGDLGITAEAKAQVTVAGLAELSFTIGQDNGTVEIGASTTYSVQVSNVGNQPDKNVQLMVQLPEGTKLLQVDAPSEYRVDGDRIIFAPITEIRSRDAKTFRFQVQHNRAGNQVVRSQLTSENRPVAVVKEEGTLVYNDQN